MTQSIRIDILLVTVSVVSAVLFGFSYVCARELPECNGVTSDTYINTTRPNCNYSLTYCNGANSQFCDQRNLCDENYYCNAQEFPECNGVESETFINHTRPNCNNHSLIYCAGENSQFCDDQNSCDFAYTCDEATTASTEVTTDSSSTTDTSTTVSADVHSLCRHGVTQKYTYPDNCNYYWHCLNGFLVVEECPNGYAFHESNGTCSGYVADIPNCKRR